MARMVLGLFDNRDHAEMVVNELSNLGFTQKDISVMVKEEVAKEMDLGQATTEKVSTGALTGATTGGVIGALAGLLVGVGAIAIPGFGALLVGGPLAAALGLGGAAATTVSGAITGLLAGGVVGALVNLGVPEEQARVYEERLAKGSILIAVPTRDSNPDDEQTVTDIMNKHQAAQVNVVNS